MKANYASSGVQLDLMWRDGVFEVIGPPQGIFAGMANRNAESAFLDGLDALTKAGRNLSDNSHSGNYAPKAIMRTTHGKGFKRHDLASAMERLFSDGKIRCEDYGRPGDTRRRIVKTQQEK